MNLPTETSIFLNLLEDFESHHDKGATPEEIEELKAMARDTYRSMMEAYREWPGPKQDPDSTRGDSHAS